MPRTHPPHSGIFILSMPRSGSTMLRYVLNGHRNICSPDELALGRLASNLKHALHRTVGFRTPEEQRESRVNAEVRSRLDDLMEQAADLRDKEYWCEKTPGNLVFLDHLYSVYPDAKYICLYRNCMDVANSLLDLSRNGWMWDGFREYLQGDNTVAAAVRYWIDRTNQLGAFEKTHADQCFHVKYETLVLSPRPTLKALFEFLGVEWYESLLTDGVQSTEKEGGRGKVLSTDEIHASRVGKGRRIPVERIGDDLRRRLNATLQAIGYAPVTDDFNTEPSAYVPDEVREALQAQAASEQAPTAAITGEHVESYLQEKASNPALRGVRGSVKVVVNDIANGIWTVDLGKGTVERSNASTTCTVAMTTSTFERLVDGAINTTEARIDGDIRTSGDERVIDHLDAVL